MLRYRSIIELVTEVPVFLKLKRGADLHLMRLIKTSNRRQRRNRQGNRGDNHRPRINPPDSAPMKMPVSLMPRLSAFSAQLH
jgi:hypothetical protein